VGQRGFVSGLEIRRGFAGAQKEFENLSKVLQQSKYQYSEPT
jgi:hypothetical protein